MKTEETTSLNLATDELNTKVEKIAKDIVIQDDPDEIKKLVQQFNLAHTKKQILRSLTYDQLLDSITDQMKERVTLRGDQFSNKDLLDYLNTMNNGIEKAQKQFTDVESIPKIQINQQNNITVNETLDRESRERVLSVVNALMQNIKNTQLQEEIVENTQILEDSSVQDQEEPIINFASEDDDYSEDTLDNLYSREDQ